MKIIIVGGVAGGAGCAARLRRLNEDCEIIIFERTNYISYANCGLPYYIGDVITKESSLTLQTPNSFKSRFNVDVRVSHEVTKIDSLKKIVYVTNLKTNEEFVESYDKLVLSPGAKPILLPFYKESDKMFVIRTVEDTFRLKNKLTPNIKSAIIVGGGYIGCEMAENLVNLGINVSIVDKNTQILANLDSDMVSFVQNTARTNKLDLYLNRSVVNVFERGNQLYTILDSKESIVSDILICAVGVMPDTSFISSSQIELGPKGSIIVNEHMQTSNPDIYAVGDAVSIKNSITNQDALISLAGPAAKQARVAANHICGIDDAYYGSTATSIMKFFDLTIGTVGINERMCKDLRLTYEKVILTPVSHASYYPNSKALTVKVIYNKDTKKLLGAQIVGYDGVDKRIDVLATAIKCNMDATYLKDLDLSYAPPYSSSKDPVNLAGFIIDNLEKGIVKQFYYEDLAYLRTQDVILLDTRTPVEVSRGMAEGFRHIPLDELRNRINELDKNKKVYVMCQSGLRSYIATRILVQNGFDAYNFVGGYLLYNSIKNNEKLTKQTMECGIEKELVNVK